MLTATGFDVVKGHRLLAQPATRGCREHRPADPQQLKVAFTGGYNVSSFRMRKPINPVAPYIGGKRNLAKRICRIIDAHDHRTYAEPFVGMGGIFLRRSSRPGAEFINDRSRDVYNLFRILQEHYVAFLDLLRFQITTQANFERLRDLDPETLTDLQRAARFLYLQRISFGGKVTGRHFGVSPDRPARFDLHSLEPDLEALHSRLSGVTVTCMDFAAFIARIDRPGTLFYLDPPYFGCEGDYGRDVFGRESFDQLSGQLREIRGDFLLSINDRPEIRALFEWATIVPVATTYTLAAKSASAAPELLVSNLPASRIETHLKEGSKR